MDFLAIEVTATLALLIGHLAIVISERFFPEA